MALAIKPQHFKRYREIAELLVKHGRDSFLRDHDRLELVGEDGLDGNIEKRAEELARDLEEMGPIFIKLGQALSSRADLLPKPYSKALSRLQDNLEPFPFQEVEEAIREDLGVRISKAFLEFEPKPIGTASLGQVHRAALRDGRPVVVKVQRPGIRASIADDLDAMEQIAELADNFTEAGRKFRFTELIAEFRKDLVRELDYRQEAKHLQEIGENLRRFKNILIPAPIDDLTSSRVLTMDYISGRKITSLSPLARLEMDGEKLAEDLFRAYLKQILVDGIFHADPHPGNVFITDDHRIALIDLGMVGHVTSGLQEQLLRFLIAIGEGKADEAAEVAIKISDLSENFDESGFRRNTAALIAEQHGAKVGEIQVGKALVEFTHVSSDSGIRLPAELMLLAKALFNLDEIGRILDPEFDPNDAIRRYAAEITRQRLTQSLSPGNVLNAAIETREFLSELPGRVNHILDLLAKNRLRLEVQAIDEATLIEGFQKVANRITMGLILAALIIGASMLMRVETSFRLFGYPGFAMLCFLAAAGGGFWLVLTILMSDRKPKGSP